MEIAATQTEEHYVCGEAFLTVLDSVETHRAFMRLALAGSAYALKPLKVI